MDTVAEEGQDTEPEAENVIITFCDCFTEATCVKGKQPKEYNDDGVPWEPKPHPGKFPVRIKLSTDELSGTLKTLEAIAESAAAAKRRAAGIPPLYSQGPPPPLEMSDRAATREINALPYIEVEVTKVGHAENATTDLKTLLTAWLRKSPEYQPIFFIRLYSVFHPRDPVDRQYSAINPFGRFNKLVLWCPSTGTENFIAQLSPESAARKFWDSHKTGCPSVSSNGLSRFQIFNGNPELSAYSLMHVPPDVPSPSGKATPFVLLKRQSGKRSPTQNQVMKDWLLNTFGIRGNGSATQTARLLYKAQQVDQFVDLLDSNDEVTWDWLHRQAFSQGGSQSAGNLVLGTAHANSLMMVHEGALSSFFNKKGCDVHFSTKADPIFNDPRFNSFTYDLWLCNKPSAGLGLLKETIARLTLEELGVTARPKSTGLRGGSPHPSSVADNSPAPETINYIDVVNHIAKSGLTDSVIGILMSSVVSKLAFVQVGDEFVVNLGSTLDSSTVASIMALVPGVELRSQLRFEARFPCKGESRLDYLVLTARTSESTVLVSRANFSLALDQIAVDVYLIPCYHMTTGFSGTSWGIQLRGAMRINFSGDLELKLRAYLSFDFSSRCTTVNAVIDRWINALGIPGLSLGSTGINFSVQEGGWKTATLSLWATVSFEHGAEANQFHLRLDGTLSSSISGVVASVQDFTWADVIAMFRALFKQTYLPNSSSHGELLQFKDITVSLSSADGNIGRGIPVKKGASLRVVCVYDTKYIVEGFVKLTPEGLDLDCSFKGDFSIGDGAVVIKAAHLVLSVHTSKPVQCMITGTAELYGITFDVTAARFVSGGKPAYVVCADVQHFSLRKLCPILPVECEHFGASWASAPVPDTDLLPTGYPYALDSAVSKLGNENGAGNLRLSYSASAGVIELTPTNDLNIKLGSGLCCKSLHVVIDTKFELRLNFDVYANVGTGVNYQELKFVAQIAVSLKEFKGSLTMESKWKNPFGVENLSVGRLAAELGVVYASPQLPVVGIAGEFELGNFKGSMALKLSPIPDEVIMQGSIQNLSLADLFTDISCLTGIRLPEALVRIPPDVLYFEELSLCLAGPSGGTIGTRKFDPGFSFCCKATVLSKKANPQFRLAVKTGSAPEVLLDGAIDIGQIFSLGVFLKLDASGVDLEGTLKVGPYELELSGHLSGCKDTSGIAISLDGSFKDTSEIRKGTLSFAKDAAHSALMNVGQAEEMLRSAQEKFNASIAVSRDTFIKAEEEFMLQVKQRSDEIDTLEQNCEYIEALLGKETLSQEIFGVTERIDMTTQSLQNIKAKWDANIQDLSEKAQSAIKNLQYELEKSQNSVSAAKRDLEKAESDFKLANIAWLGGLVIGLAVVIPYRVYRSRAQEALNKAEQEEIQAKYALEAENTKLREAMNDLQQKRDFAVKSATENLTAAKETLLNLQDVVRKQLSNCYSTLHLDLRNLDLILSQFVVKLKDSALNNFSQVLNDVHVKAFLGITGELLHSLQRKNIPHLAVVVMRFKETLLRLSSSQYLKKIITLAKSYTNLVGTLLAKLASVPKLSQALNCLVCNSCKTTALIQELQSLCGPLYYSVVNFIDAAVSGAFSIPGVKELTTIFLSGDLNFNVLLGLVQNLDPFELVTEKPQSEGFSKAIQTLTSLMAAGPHQGAAQSSSTVTDDEALTLVQLSREHLELAKSVLDVLYAEREKSRNQAIVAFDALLSGDLTDHLLLARANLLRAQRALDGLEQYATFFDSLNPSNWLQIRKLCFHLNLNSSSLKDTTFSTHIVGSLFHQDFEFDFRINLQEITAFFADFFKYLWNNFTAIFKREREHPSAVVSHASLPSSPSLSSSTLPDNGYYLRDSPGIPAVFKPGHLLGGRISTSFRIKEQASASCQGSIYLRIWSGDAGKSSHLDTKLNESSGTPEHGWQVYNAFLDVGFGKSMQLLGAGGGHPLVVEDFSLVAETLDLASRITHPSVGDASSGKPVPLTDSLSKPGCVASSVLLKFHAEGDSLVLLRVGDSPLLKWEAKAGTFGLTLPRLAGDIQVFGICDAKSRKLCVSDLCAWVCWIPLVLHVPTVHLGGGTQGIIGSVTRPLNVFGGKVLVTFKAKGKSGSQVILRLHSEGSSNADYPLHSAETLQQVLHLSSLENNTRTDTPVPLSDPISKPGLHILSIFMRFSATDQGWGNQKSRVLLKLVSDNDVTTMVQAHPKVLDHEWATFTYTRKFQQAASRSLQLYGVVGGGGGHMLKVKNLSIWVLCG
ncbi:hypothetical protein Pelo_14230 [Pelomyxa schiedti]|nr:hypothetical protein Pelo_14230 [Pelomyxa schiedti]